MYSVIRKDAHCAGKLFVLWGAFGLSDGGRLGRSPRQSRRRRGHLGGRPARRRLVCSLGRLSYERRTARRRRGPGSSRNGQSYLGRVAPAPLQRWRVLRRLGHRVGLYYGARPARARRIASVRSDVVASDRHRGMRGVFDRPRAGKRGASCSAARCCSANSSTCSG